MSYRQFFGLTCEPFSSDLEPKRILQTEAIGAVDSRVHYTMRAGGILLVTGEVGAGKSTALRWCTKQLHPSKHRVLWITASSGSILEVYRQLLAEFDIATVSNSKAFLTRRIREQIVNVVTQLHQQLLLVIDEASLLRIEVFAELHTLTQFEGDSKPWLPIVLVGQKNLADNLLHRSVTPLASRIIARTHIQEVDREHLERYLAHHLAIAGIKNNLYDANAVTAIHQGSGGLYRKANNLARGALVAAAADKSTHVTAEHVRQADSELI
jgi:type II secretory pathway predicted ATPase ExeA